MTAVMQFTTACASGRSATWGASPSCVRGNDNNKNVVHGWATKGFRASKCSTFCNKQSRRKEVVRMGLPQDEQVEEGASRSTVRSMVRAMKTTALAVTLGLSLSLGGVDVANAKRLEGVNKPELLPKEFTTVIDVAGFLSSGQEVRIKEAVASLEEDTGYKLRVLAQNYPNTPGLAVRDFWKVDENTVVFVADPSLGNILNFNVGAGVDLSIPRSFWTRLAGKYGNKFYWQEKGEDASIEAAVQAIGACLREPGGPRACAEINFHATTYLYMFSGAVEDDMSSANLGRTGTMGASWKTSYPASTIEGFMDAYISGNVGGLSNLQVELRVSRKEVGTDGNIIVSPLGFYFCPVRIAGVGSWPQDPTAAKYVTPASRKKILEFRHYRDSL